MKFTSKFSSFTNRDCLPCAIMKALYGFREKRAHKVDRQEMCIFFLQNVEKEIFKILKMFESNMKFTRAAWRINSKISNRNKNTTLIIFLFCHYSDYCWSLLWWNYWRFLMLWNSTSLSRIKLTVEIQLANNPYNQFLINNRNMTGNSVKK